jgi:hypothetical protein
VRRRGSGFGAKRLPKWILSLKLSAIANQVWRDKGMNWVYDDGGRQAAGFRGKARDCVTRSIAIATRLPYRHVYELLNEQARCELPTRGRRSSARNGIFRQTCQRVLESQFRP